MTRNADSRKRRLETRLLAAFEAEPVEDGMIHPAEEIIEKALRAGGPEVFGWIEEFCLLRERPVFAASVLRCLRHIPEPGTYSRRAGIVRAALASGNVEMRDAAVQAAESWEDERLCAVLAEHSDPVPWLQKYADDVIRDLGGRKSGPGAES